VPGKLTRIAVTYTIDTPKGPRHTFHGLPHMHRHIRPERLTELLDDLTVICEELCPYRRHRARTALAAACRHGQQWRTGI
jgi:hypothetical protein